MTGVSLAGLAAGTYPNAVSAVFAGDSTYSGSNATGALVVGAATQTVPTTVSEVTVRRDFERDSHADGHSDGGCLKY